jgi:hypothetical protein
MYQFPSKLCRNQLFILFLLNIGYYIIAIEVKNPNFNTFIHNIYSDKYVHRVQSWKL